MNTGIRQFIETKFRPGARGAAFDDDTPLFSSGIVDSFGVIELIAFLEEAFKIDVDLSRHELGDFDSVKKIEQLVASLQSPSGDA
jgi:acyl carrier protein